MKRLLVLLLLCLLVAQSLISQTKRIALVIGNENYQNNLPLYNPINDANSMDLVLKEAGFDVLKYIDLDKNTFDAVIETLGEKLSEYEVCLFFYAGHGLQYEGANFLVPIDAHLKSEADIKIECVEAQKVLQKMEDASNNTNIVILDACRNNPFTRGWTRSTSSEGLAFMNAPSSSIIAYSTSPGNTASDGSGSNGLYTSILTHYMKFPDLKIEDVFKRVRKVVREKSGGKQVPWENMSLEGDFYFFQNDDFYNDTNEDPEKEKEVPKNTFFDMRDGHEYKYVKLGDQIWMAENLNFEKENSWCYGNSSRNCNIYGRLYTWESAKDACPVEWKLPSDQDWKELELFIGMDKNSVNEKYFRGDNEAELLKVKGDDHWIETNDKIRDEFGFSILPAGNRSPDGMFYDLGKSAMYYSSTPYGSNSAWVRITYYNNPKIFRFSAPQVLAASIRCIYDKKDKL